jgi:multidrug efflux pump
VKLPEGASLDRTEVVVRRMSEMALATEGVRDAVAFPGLNAIQFSNTPNIGTIFFCLEGFGKRARPAPAIAEELMGKFSAIQETFAFAFMPPPILGIGTGSGFSLYVQDRAGFGYGELQQAVTALAGALSQTPGISFPITSYQSNVPQLTAEIDRSKAKMQGVALTDVFETMQVYLGSVYVNDFNRFGRTYPVYAQAEAGFRDDTEDVAELKARNEEGEMVPIGSLVKVDRSYGPDPVIRYNGYPATDLLGGSDPAVMSSAEAIGVIEALAPRVLPAGMGHAWTDLSFQQITEGSANLVVFPLSVLLVFLVLAALYESFSLPLAVILIVPMCMLSALFAVWQTGGDNNIFVKIGLVVLMGLACKNAILIVEFARELEFQGRGIAEAAVEACRLRLRPIVMTSVAFIAGVVPLVVAHGAGAEVRRIKTAGWSLEDFAPLLICATTQRFVRNRCINPVWQSERSRQWGRVCPRGAPSRPQELGGHGRSGREIPMQVRGREPPPLVNCLALAAVLSCASEACRYGALQTRVMKGMPTQFPALEARRLEPESHEPRLHLCPAWKQAAHRPRVTVLVPQLIE